MAELVDGRTLRCELDGEHTHDRCVTVCYLDGADIAAIISGGRYRAEGGKAAAVNVRF
jgi:micrococcal nuclease